MRVIHVDIQTAADMAESFSFVAAYFEGMEEQGFFVGDSLEMNRPLRRLRGFARYLEEAVAEAGGTS